MSLVKTSLLNGIAITVKVASTLVLNKILAVYVDPAGSGVPIIEAQMSDGPHSSVPSLRAQRGNPAGCYQNELKA